MDNNQEATRYMVQTHTMFSRLPADDKERIRSLVEIRQFAKADMLVDQNSDMDGMYYFYTGQVRLKQTTGGKRVSLGLMGAETSVGEISLLKPSQWQFQIFATEPTVAFWLPADKVRALAARSPAMHDLFTQQVGLTELSHRLRGLLGTAKYTPDQLNVMLENIGVKSLNRGETLYETGQSDPRLYYIERGSIDLVATTAAGEELVLDTVRKGDLLGEGGALPDIGSLGVQPHTARAVTDVTTLVIKAAEVAAILKINPELHEQLRVRVKYLASRVDSEADARKRAEGIDQRVRLADAVTEAEYLAQTSRAFPTKDKFPLVKQQEAAECGAACLAMITQHYGKNFSAGQVREITGLSVANPTPNNIITAAEKLGFNSKAYALEYDDLLRLSLPAVIGWEDYHYAVLFKITATEAHVADPEAGIRRLSREEFNKSWSSAEVPGVTTSANHGVYIAFYPTQVFLNLHEPTRPFIHFLNYILPFKFYFGEAMLAALTINLLGLASPLFVQNIVDTVIVHKDVGLLNVMLVGMVLVAALTALSTAAQSLLLAFVTARIDLKLVAEFYRHVLSLPMSFFLTRNKGEILARFGENQKIRQIMAGETITVILNTMMIVIYLVMMFAYSARLTLIFLAFIPIYFAIILYFTPLFRAIANKIFFTYSESQSALIEALNGIESLKATGNEYMARARWEDSFVDNVNMGYKSAKLELTSTTLYTLATLGSSIAILWVGANLVMAGTMTIGELMGFNMLMGLVTGPIMGMVGLWQSIQEVRISVERVSDVLNVAPEEPAITGPENMRTPLSNVQGKIEFANVNFSYVSNGEQALVMKDFSLTIEPGMRVAFVGPSGCGKSTIAKMILGFNVPLGGTCMIDGHPIGNLDLGILRRHIGVVLQDSFLFAGTVAQNIALGDPDPDMQPVVEAAKLAGAHEFVLNYPLGYHTLIGEKGMGVSGGQRQRLCIARALYHKPKIMIFDEATSALDEESQSRIQENMRQVLSGRTSITIAHRLTTIIDSDMICYINQGKVMEKGTHEQLTNQAYLKENHYSGRYYELAQPQFNLPRLHLD